MIPPLPFTMRNLLDSIVDQQFGDVPPQAGVCGLHKDQDLWIDSQPGLGAMIRCRRGIPYVFPARVDHPAVNNGCGVSVALNEAGSTKK